MANNTKTVLITGAAGMLGKDVCQAFAGDKDFIVFGTDRQASSHFAGKDFLTGDLTDSCFVDNLLSRTNPDIIVQCAAIVDVDGCENNRDLADKLHILSTASLASFQPGKTRLIYISTDSVFDGERGNYTETDSPNPLNYYAKSKYSGESAALDNNPNSLILRTNIYGFHTPSGKSLVEWALGELSQSKVISGFTDVYFNPLYTKQLAEIIRTISALDHKGIVNAVSDKSFSKYEFLLEIAKANNYSPELVQKSSVENIRFKAPRPKNTTLNPSLLRHLLGKVPSLKEGLDELRRDWEKSSSSK